MNDEALLAYLAEHRPYLYDVEMRVIKVQTSTGHGQVSMNLQIVEGKVHKADVFSTMSKIYIPRDNNRL